MLRRLNRSAFGSNRFFSKPSFARKIRVIILKSHRPQRARRANTMPCCVTFAWQKVRVTTALHLNFTKNVKCLLFWISRITFQKNRNQIELSQKLISVTSDWFNELYNLMRILCKFTWPCWLPDCSSMYEGCYDARSPCSCQTRSSTNSLVNLGQIPRARFSIISLSASWAGCVLFEKNTFATRAPICKYNKKKKKLMYV